MHMSEEPCALSRLEGDFAFLSASDHTQAVSCSAGPFARNRCVAQSRGKKMAQVLKRCMREQHMAMPSHHMQDRVIKNPV
eukprot:1146314-Pelagomonas_calceolata.AAC.7